MRFLFRKNGPEQIEFALIYGGLTILLLAAARFLPVLDLAPECAFRTLTGLPCPTCGSTRSVMCLSSGQVLSAFSLNPLTAAVCIAALIGFGYRFLALMLHFPRIGIDLSAREKNLLRFVAVSAFIVNWIYLVSTL